MGLADRARAAWSAFAKPQMAVDAGTAVSTYDAASPGRRLAGWRATDAAINTLLAAGGVTLRARARQMCRENAYAANAKDAFVSAAVGTGIKPSSLIADPEKKRAVQQAFLRWTDEADSDWLTDFYGLQAFAAGAMFEAGECFIRFRPRRPEDGLSVPLQLQLLESELLPYDHNEVLADGRRIVCGIEFDAIGRRTAYHFLKRHPGEITGVLDGLEKVIVPASEVLHLYRPLRPGQVRGQPAITPGMIRLYLLDSYDDAELERKRVAALFAGFVTRPAETDVSSNDPTAGGVLAPSVEYGALPPLEPGLMQELGPGEDVKFSNPVEVGGSYEAFQFRSLCAISAAVGIPYHVISGDLTKANYGSQRGGQIEYRRRMDQFQWATLIYQFCRPVWERWLQAAVLAGAVPLTVADLRNGGGAVKWITPTWQWIDPLKDRQAQALAEDRGWIARSDSVEAEGFDIEEVDARIAADRDRERRLGLSFPQGAVPAQTVEPEPEPV